MAPSRSAPFDTRATPAASRYLVTAVIPLIGGGGGGGGGGGEGT